MSGRRGKKKVDAHQWNIPRERVLSWHLCHLIIRPWLSISPGVSQSLHTSPSCIPCNTRIDHVIWLQSFTSRGPHVARKSCDSRIFSAYTRQVSVVPFELVFYIHYQTIRFLPDRHVLIYHRWSTFPLECGTVSTHQLVSRSLLPFHPNPLLL